MGERNYELCQSVEGLEKLCTRLIYDELPFGFDIETGYYGQDREKGSLRTETNIVVGISLTNSLHWAQYVPLAHDGADNVDNYQAARLLWVLLNTGRGVAHNALFEMRNLARWFRELLGEDPQLGEQVRAVRGYFPIRSCTQVEAYLVCEHKDPASYRPVLGLKPLVEIMFGHKMRELSELFPGLPKNKYKYLRFNLLDPTDPEVRNYACEDALWCLAVHERYHPVVRERGLYRVDKSVLRCNADMADVGIRYDYGYMAWAAEELRDFQSRFNAEIMAELSEMAGHQIGINLASWKAVGDVLYGKLGMRTSVYTKSTKDLPPDQRVMSTGAIALTGLAKQYAVVKKILQWKEISKLLGSYLDKYERTYGGAPDGNIHPNLASALVVTGRFACADPNYMASPKKYHFDLEVAKAAHAAGATPPPGSCFEFNFRDAVIAPPGWYIIGFDLSQAELRAIAGEAQEHALLEAFAQGRDVHTLTASLMLGVPLDQVTEDQRAIGKTMNFALLYGMGVKSLADRLAMDKDKAQELYDDYFRAYPAIAVWSEKQRRFARKNLHVTSRFGRRLPIWEFLDERRYIQEKGERAAVNYPIQGAATGDYVRIAMVRARQAIIDAGLADKVKMVMNVHDALEFYVQDGVLPHDVIKLLDAAVIFPVSGWPAMAADWHIARKWGSPLGVKLDDDGRLMTTGKKVFEITPELVEDEESGDEELLFPDDDVDAVRRALKVAPREEPGRALVVELADMPDEIGWLAFRRLLDERPGPHTVTLRTPQGEVDLPGTTGLDPKSDLAQINLLLGPTKIIYQASDVDARDVVEGLTL